MNIYIKKNHLTLIFILIIFLNLSGCAQKAKSIKVGAAQFEVESLAAIQKIEEIHIRELQTTPHTQEEEIESFISYVEDGDITQKELIENLHPFKLDLIESEKKWQVFLEKLRSDYRLLTATFANLDKGSFFAKDSVGKTANYINKLTVNMIVLANSVKDNPPRYRRLWAEYSAMLELIKDNDKFSPEVKELRYKDIYNRLIILEIEEAQLGREAIELCLKSAILGLSLKKLVEDYNTLSIDDISEAIGIALKVAGDVSGKDLSSLRTNVDDITNKIKSDEMLNLLFTEGINKINGARPNNISES